MSNDIDINTIELNEKPIQKLPFIFAKRHQVVVIEKNKTPYLFFVKFPNLNIISEINRFLDYRPIYKQINLETFSNIIADCYQDHHTQNLQDVNDISNDIDLNSLAEAVPIQEDLLEQTDDAPVIKLINTLLAEALKENASDIHIETYESHLIVRIRIDGMLREILKLKRSLAALLVSRIKVMAKLDIAEKRVPQDGRISLKIAGKEIDIRVSTLPSSNGERVVLRLLEKTAKKIELTHLGISSSTITQINEMLQYPHGIILVTGPTGSGKTTTLYSSLTTINESHRNILTIEDPIEYNLEGIGQTQVNNKTNMSFANGLRAILRQDPDVIMIGEIRDSETADIAIQASLTGHLVLSTLHTNTAVGAITRLQDIGVKPFLLASSLICIASQRLVRVLCNLCKKAHAPNEYECKILNIPNNQQTTIYSRTGCKKCNHSGYKGRTGIYEVISIDQTLKTMIHANDSEQKITNYAHNKYPSLQQDGIRKVLEGVTTIEEIFRVTQQK